MSTTDKLLEIIYEAVDDLNSQLPQGGQIIKSPDSKLYGTLGVLDSISLVSLIVSIEEKVQDSLDLAITIADDKAVSQRNSPFLSIKSLHDYLQKIVEEAKARE